MTVRWLTAFIDLPADAFSSSVRFWEQVTGSTLSAARGERHEFATLLPPDGDAYLRVQRLDDEPAGCHLDVHVDDIDATAQRASALGAEVERQLDDVIVMRSPASLAFCVVGHDAGAVRPAPVRHDGGWRTRLDQVCIDIPADTYQQECVFWSALTGWELQSGALSEFSFLVRPPGVPLRLLLQRLGETAAGRRAGAHLDLACDDANAAAVAQLDCHRRRGRGSDQGRRHGRVRRYRRR